MKVKRDGTGRNAQDGVTLVELMIAVLVMTIGLLGMAQLFVVASMNNGLAKNISSSLNRAEREIELKKIAAASNINDAAIDSSITTIVDAGSTANNTREMAIYVINHTGALVNPTGPAVTLPTDLAAVYGAGQTVAPSPTSRIVIVRITPQPLNNRLNQRITLVGHVFQQRL